MKKVFITYILVFVILLSGCSFSFGERTTEPYYEYEYGTSAVFDTVPTETTSADGTSSENQTDEEVLTALPSEEVTLPSEAETVTEEKRETQPTSENNSVNFSEVDLSISIPEKNGTMVTDKSSDNKYIQIVKKDRKISAELLVAVFSVPESGQNYVFEFKKAGSRTVNDIRRVYLIDSNGKIVSVAATDADEKENISAVENWFCMNVLIKEIIFPAVEKDMK